MKIRGRFQSLNCVIMLEAGVFVAEFRIFAIVSKYYNLL